MDNQIRNEINVMKENKMFFKTENLQKLIGRPVTAMALDHPLLKKNTYMYCYIVRALTFWLNDL